MIRSLLVLSIILSTIIANAQSSTWTWMRGDSTGNSSAYSYGIQGVPSPSNDPPFFYEASDWTDLNGNFWLMIHNNLWKFEPATNMWTWMRGPGHIPTTPQASNMNHPGDYGMQGVPAPTNLPPARMISATWTGNDNTLWLFGGQSQAGTRNDLWKYDIATNEWTWMNGSNTVSQYTVYGTIGVPAPTNSPGSRFETSCTWVDASGMFWLYGGIGFTDVALNNLEELWKYDPSTNIWTWMNGSNTPYVQPSYGVKGVPSASNTPGGRLVFARWKDQQGNLWLFGGSTKTAAIGQVRTRNDMWKYNVQTGLWTWMSGTNLPGDTQGNYGTKGVPSVNNYPPSQYETRSCWTDSCGIFWLFGGAGLDSTNSTISHLMYNDLWAYDPVTNEWTWVSGDGVPNTVNAYGTMGVPSTVCEPGPRTGAASWMDNSGNLWMLGGGGLYPNNPGNALWKFTPGQQLKNILCGKDEPSAVNDQLSETGINVYPNPFQHEIQIALQNNGYIRAIKVIDMLGRDATGSFVLQREGNTCVLAPLSDAASGMYYIGADIEGRWVYRKVVMKK